MPKPTDERRAAARRRAWGRGPMILRFEPLEGRPLLAASAAGKPDLVATHFETPHNLDWGDSFHATGTIQNQGDATAPAAFKVDVYASATQTIGPDAVLVGSIEVPSGLTPGASSAFDQAMKLPPAPVPDLG